MSLMRNRCSECTTSRDGPGLDPDGLFERGAGEPVGRQPGVHLVAEIRGKFPVPVGARAALGGLQSPLEQVFEAPPTIGGHGSRGASRARSQAVAARISR
jgi:hypothetical protein